MSPVIRAIATLSLAFMAPVAFAAGNWYLLLPPTTDYNQNSAYLRGYEVLVGLPVKQWVQDGSYNTRAQCEAVRSNRLVIEENFYSKLNAAYLSAIGAFGDAADDGDMRFAAERANVDVNVWTASRCVKGDDPSLAPLVLHASTSKAGSPHPQ